MENSAAQSLLTLLKEIKTIIDKCLKNKLHYGDFTIPQTMIICNLTRSGKMKISELSERMGLTNSTVSGIVDRLEDQGIFARRRCNVDRRVVYVELAPEQKGAYALTEDPDKYLENIILEIPSEQLNLIMESLTILKNTFSGHLAD
jgi:DNA-binding MarR family transcriptional regulator